MSDAVIVVSDNATPIVQANSSSPTVISSGSGAVLALAGTEQAVIDYAGGDSDPTILVTGAPGGGGGAIPPANNSIEVADEGILQAAGVMRLNFFGDGVDASVTGAIGQISIPGYNVFTSTIDGLAPFSGGGTTKFLRADGTWAVPPTGGGGGGPGTSSWGGITGSLAAQTDLVAEFATKEPTITGGTTAQYWRGDKSWQTLNKAAVGLSNVDNTSDASKPISSATATALANKIGVGPVGSSGLTMNTARILGRTTASSGAIEELTAVGAKTLLAIAAADVSGLAYFATGTDAANLTGTVAAARLPAITGGDVTAAAGSAVHTIASGAVTLAKMASVATGTVFYRKTAGAGAPEVQTLATLKTDLGLTGTNSGDQTITLTGPVTGSGTGSFATTIGANVLTNAMLAQVATATFKGRTTAATGNVEDLTATQATALLNAFGGANGTTGGTKGLVVAPAATDNVKYLKGDGTWSAIAASGITGLAAIATSGSGADLGANSVTLGKIATQAAATILGNNTAGVAAPIALTAAQVKTLLAISASDVSGLATIASSGSAADLSAGTILAARMPAHTGDATSSAGSVALTIASGAVSLAKMANLAASSILGNNTGVSATPLALTGTQVTAMLDTVTTTLKGLAPASGGGTTNYLRADGSWAAPPGNGGVSDGDKGDITVTGGAWAIDAGAVTLAKMASVATGTVFYRKTAGTGAPEVQTLATLKTDLGLTGANSGDQTITLTGDVTGSGTASFAASIGANKVTRGMLAATAGATVLGATTAGNVADLTAAQVKTFLALTAVDFSFTQSGTGADSRTGLDKLRELITPADFGAVGNGTTDDTASILEAATAAASVGRLLDGCGKLYGVSELSLPVNLHIRNFRFKELSPQGSSSRKTVKCIGTGAASEWFKAENITIDRNGDGTVGSLTQSAGLWVQLVARVDLIRPEVFGNGIGNGIFIDSATSGSVESPYIHDIRYAHTTQTDDTVQGLYLNNCANVTISNPRIASMGRADLTTILRDRFSRAIPMGGCSNCHVIGGSLSRVDQGVDFTGSAGNSHCSMVGMTVSHVFSVGGKIANSGQKNIIANNVFDNCGICGVLLGGPSAANPNMTMGNLVTGNVFRNIGANNYQASNGLEAWGVRLDRNSSDAFIGQFPKGSKIHGNHFETDEGSPFVTANTTTDLLTLSQGVPMSLGARVRFTTSGTLPGGLAINTDYWLIPVTDTLTAKVASSYINALDGLGVDLTSTGTGTHQMVLQQNMVYAVGTNQDFAFIDPIAPNEAWSNTAKGIKTALYHVQMYEPYLVRVNHGSAQVVATTAWTVVVPNNELSDFWGVHSSGVFTVPRDGRVSLTARIYFAAFASGDAQSRVELDSGSGYVVVASEYRGGLGASAPVSVSIRWDGYVKKGNSIRLSARQASGGNVNLFMDEIVFRYEDRD